MAGTLLHIAFLYVPFSAIYSLCIGTCGLWQNHRISRIVLCGDAISEASATTTSMGKTKRENQEKTLSMQHTFLQVSCLALHD